ncbi:hemolysin family protein [Flavobacterium cerinum]|uniref:HlyC/CorC family transporter n=1 Tax=Flavobacterium cerinum TaxID=2502784 RepID=A0A444HFB6_9FLAO|nr:hemolysin family protein [Flavobacterium cerinum]RWX03641.1 HlyC/CorC family transporter [Flavobacterium cerinum]
MEAAMIIVCLLLSAFFSGMEIAYVSSNKVYLEVEKKQSTLISRILTRLTEKPTQFITAMLVGNTIVLVIYSYYMGNVVLEWLYPSDFALPVFYQLLLQIVVSSFVLLLTAEFLPKIFFQVYANTLIKFFALPAYAFYCLFNRVSKIVILISDFILVKVLRTKGDSHRAFFSRGELGNYITEQLNGADEQEEVDSEIQIFQNALGFSDLKARDIMTPRTEISAVDINDPVAELRQLFIETGYSKVIVYQESVDNIIGYIHSFELFKKPATVRSVMIPIEYVPETIYIKELLNILTRKRKSMAVILDEYGGTSGIITVEDIIEELFGEIEDEHDQEEEMIEQQLEGGAYLFSARLDVEYINEKYNLCIPESDSYATLGGFIVHNAKEIPKTGEKLTFVNFEIYIEQASNKKIELVKIEPLQNK